MDDLTSLIGFEAKYLVYPLIAVLVAGLIRWIIHRYLMRWAARTETEIDDQIIRYVDGAVVPILLLIVLYFISHLLPVSAVILEWIQRGLIVLILIVVAALSARIVSLFLVGVSQNRPAWEHYMQPVRNLVNVFFVLIAGAAILKFLNIDLTEEGVRLIRIIGIIVGAYVVLKIVRLAVARMEQMVEDQDPTHLSEAEKRARTIGKIITSISLVLVIGVAVMMILSEFGMDITPIITGAGIAGLAVGFGAQNLVRDIISGFFLILEDQVRIGDVVKINDTAGLVEAIRLRTLVLRDLHGTVHTFPNGEIRQVSNMTKEWSRYVIDVGVAYKEDVDYVMQVLREIGEELARDETYGPLILEPLEVLGVDDFGESQVTIKAMIKTLPLKQWTVGRELRRRIKKTFDEKGIEIPFPHVSVYFGEASKPFALLLQHASGQPLIGGSAESDQELSVRDRP